MASAAALPTPSFGAAYARRQPEQSPLHRAVQGHLAAFLDQSEPPSFVARALRRFLDCGVLAKGFVRVYCDACKQEQLVAFSCKGRGFCPSCSAGSPPGEAAGVPPLQGPRGTRGFGGWRLRCPRDPRSVLQVQAPESHSVAAGTLELGFTVRIAPRAPFPRRKWRR
jgi:hypothetical protein